MKALYRTNVLESSHETCHMSQVLDLTPRLGFAPYASLRECNASVLRDLPRGGRESCDQATIPQSERKDVTFVG